MTEITHASRLPGKFNANPSPIMGNVTTFGTTRVFASYTESAITVISIPALRAECPASVKNSAVVKVHAPYGQRESRIVRLVSPSMLRYLTRCESSSKIGCTITMSQSQRAK